MNAFPSFERKYVAPDFKVAAWSGIQKYTQELQDRKITDDPSLQGWLEDLSELISVVFEEGTAREVTMTCHTEDEAIKEKHMDFVENIDPNFKEAIFNLYQKALASSAFKNQKKSIPQIVSMIETEVDLFSPKNLPLEVQESKLCQKYQEITGSWMVTFEGREHTMPEMLAYLESNDPTTRKNAFLAITSRRVHDKNTLNTLYDDLFQVRQTIATNAGLPDYRSYLFKANRREYSPEDCYEFHDSVLKTVVPLVAQMRQKKATLLGQKTLYPWDNACDPLKAPPLKPFSNVKELQDGVESIFNFIDPRLKNYFHLIRDRMDLDSRRGKAPGGYQATFDEQRLPFIFMNAAGMQDDVETLLHEAGHSFHSLQHRNQNLYWHRGAPMEFCEVCSMSFELIGGPHFGVFYDNEEAGARARLKHLTGVLELFPWVMTVDAFQHWIYTHPGHSVAEREAQWKAIHQKFDAGVDWSPLSQDVQTNWWHKQLHIFLDPFYYIEYAISQLGSLQIYRNYKKNNKKTLDEFLQAMSLGASKSCREIYTAAGIEFRFDAAIVGELASLVHDEIRQLEAQLNI